MGRMSFKTYLVAAAAVAAVAVDQDEMNTMITTEELSKRFN